MLSIPIIQIDSGKARKLDISIALRKIYYHPNGYQRTVKKLYEASLKARYNFSIDEVYNWHKKQALYQIHKPRPRFIPRALLRVYKFLMNVTKWIFFICPMTKLII